MTGHDRRASDRERQLHVEVVGFEGPLDVLLDLAQRQKIDLRVISIEALTSQCLRSIADARHIRLELAAAYLILAAGLAYLKSRLLLPEPTRPEGQSARELARASAHRLRRLERLRSAARDLAALPQLGRDVFARGRPSALKRMPPPSDQASLHDLLAAYGRRRRVASQPMVVPKRVVWSPAEARAVLERGLGKPDAWASLDTYLAQVPHLAQVQSDASTRRTFTASAFSAALELARAGRTVLLQERSFAPVMVRAASETLAP